MPPGITCGSTDPPVLWSKDGIKQWMFVQAASVPSRMPPCWTMGHILGGCRRGTVSAMVHGVLGWTSPSIHKMWPKAGWPLSIVWSDLFCLRQALLGRADLMNRTGNSTVLFFVILFMVRQVVASLAWEAIAVMRHKILQQCNCWRNIPAKNQRACISFAASVMYNLYNQSKVWLQSWYECHLHPVIHVNVKISAFRKNKYRDVNGCVSLISIWRCPCCIITENSVPHIYGVCQMVPCIDPPRSITSACFAINVLFAKMLLYVIKSVMVYNLM